jgi:8-oxo-dGTP diphosphatase
MAKNAYIVNVEGAVYHDGRYLMIVRSGEETQDPNALAMPGGKVDSTGNLQDVLEDTLRREIIEETGVEISEGIIYLESKAFVMNSGEQVIDVVFLCRYKQGEPRPAQPDEVAEVLWMSAGEILSKPDTPQWTCQAIRKAEAVIKRQMDPSHLDPGPFDQGQGDQGRIDPGYVDPGDPPE